jgi:polysaccharide biosynthesis transport protein
MLDPNHQSLALSSQTADTNHLRTTLALPPYAQAAAGEANAGPPGLSSAPSLAGLLYGLRRRWFLASGLALLGACGAVLAVLFFLPAQYNAHARFQVFARAEVNPFIPVMNSEESDFLVYKASMASLIKSPLVVNAALNQVKDLSMIREQPRPILWLESRLKTDYLLAPEILRLSLDGESPEEVAKIVNAVTDAFMKEIENQERAKRQVRVDSLKENLRQLQSDLNLKRNAMRGRIQTDHLDDPDVLRTKFLAALEHLNAAKKAALEKYLEHVNAQQKLQTIQHNLKNLDKIPVSDSQIDQALKQDPVFDELSKQIRDTAKNMQEIKNSSAKDRQEQLLEPLRNRLADLDKQLADRRKQRRPELEKIVRQDYASKLEQDEFQLKDAIQSLKKQEELLAVEVKQREEQANRLNGKSLPLDVVTMRDDITSMEKTQVNLKDMIASMKADLGNSRVRLLLRAETPLTREYARQLKFAAVAGLGMFCLMLFGVSWWEFRARRISAADEVVQGLKMSLVGTLPSLPVSARRPAAAGTSPRDVQWQSQLSEAVDGIRTLLLHSARTESLQIVMVTSAMTGEGKTSLASQLAASLARAWRKTLLIDGDLRHPAAHKLFGLTQEPGFSEVLRSELAATDAIRPTSISRLWLMPAGHWDSHAVQALAQESVRDTFNALKTQYDFIVVDSAPVLPVADSLLLGQHVDAVIFSILRDVSRMPTVHAAQQRLNNLGIRTLGAVVIGDRDSHNSMASKYQTKAAV